MSYTHDADRRLTATTDPLGNQTLRGYNNIGELTSLTEPNGNVTSWTYDVEGRVRGKLVRRQAWRYNAPHLRFLFEMMKSMWVRRVGLDDKMNRIGEEQHVRFDIKTYPQPDPTFVEAFHDVIDEQGAAEYGFSTYSGCVVMLLSGSLLRFKDDIGAIGDDWTKAGPLFNGYSLGQVIVAAANGFRHEDEWAKTRPSTPQQKVSQGILAKALQGREVLQGRTPGSCAEVLDMLSHGGDFECLIKNMFTFAHNVAVRRPIIAKP